VSSSEMLLSSQPPNRFSQILLWAVDLIIAALVFVLPFIMGGREAWGHWFLISGALLLGVVWAVYASVTGCRYFVSWLELSLLAGLGIVFYQLQPQSAEAMTQFSGEYSRLLPVWSQTQPAGTPEHWSTLSFTPVETRHAIWMLLAYAVILTVLFQRVRSVGDCTRLMKWVAISGVLMTGFGILQWNISDGRFFWFYEHPFTDTTQHLKGAFTNRNHFAQFLSLSIGPLLWWLFRDVKRLIGGDDEPTAPPAQRSMTKSLRATAGKSGSHKKRRTTPGGTFALPAATADRFLSLPVIGLSVCVACVAIAVLMSLSRGGMIATAAAGLIAFVGLWRGFNLGGAMAGLVLGGGILFLSLLALVDQEEVQTRVDQLISTDADQVDAGGVRRAIWTADAKAIQQFPWFGTGVGSHRDVYTIYMDDYADFATFELTHAESSYVHLALETGFVGVTCLTLTLLWFLVRLLYGYLRSSSAAAKSLAVAVAASAAAATLHAVTDFIWYVPAIVVISLVLVVVGLKSVSRGFGTAAASTGLWFPRIGWAAIGGFCLLGLVQVQPELQARIVGERHWYASLRTAFQMEVEDEYGDLEAGESIVVETKQVELTPEAEAEYAAKEATREHVAQVKYHQERIGHLSKSVLACPDQHRAKLALAEQLLKLFDLIQSKSDNPFPLNMVRDTVLNGGFSSAVESREWLQRTCGKRVNLLLLADKLARESLAACPVQGHAYLSLLETSFVRESLSTQPLIDQAMLVRGHDPRVSFVAGREALTKGDQEAAIAMWDSVFHSSRYFRLNILSMLAAQAPVEFFIQQFHPNAEELKDLRDVYQVLKRERDYKVALAELCRVIPKESPSIEDEDERLKEMLLACAAAEYLENWELAVDLYQQTIKDFPGAYEAHYGLGRTLYGLERWDQAVIHLKWCHDWDPGNEWVPKMISWARREMRKNEEEKAEQLTKLSP
jgi:tetratricopeptide (TPR) repeat protein